MADHPLARLALLNLRVGLLSLLGVVVFLPTWVLTSELLPAWRFETAVLVAVAVCALVYHRVTDEG